MTKPRTHGRYTVQQRVEQYGEKARAHLKPYFEKAGVSYPPSRIVFAGLKDEKQLEVYAANGKNDLKFIRAYPILGASGGSGPKLKKGDRQVPEGFYRIESLNPNSRYHLALRISYPSGFDRERARKEGRSDLGGDIMIHGGQGSIGCLAMGDPAAEELFILAAETGWENIEVILSPVDFRKTDLSPDAIPERQWVKDLYSEIESVLNTLPAS